jgi:8-hydroxy-5-deazaflavin:NADPH oxidoreductase
MDEPIGIIGAGRLGQAFARMAQRAERPVVIANSRGPESLTSVVDTLGAGVTAGTTRDAARGSIVAQLVPGARLVKAANAFAADVLGADPREAGGRHAMFVSGDDAEATRAVGELFDAAGFFPIDIGDLATGGGMQQAGGPLAGHNLVRIPAPWE